MFSSRILSNVSRIALVLGTLLVLGISVSPDTHESVIDPEASHVMAGHENHADRDCCLEDIADPGLAHSSHGDEREHSHDADCEDCNTCVVHQSSQSIPGMVLSKRNAQQNKPSSNGLSVAFLHTEAPLSLRKIDRHDPGAGSTSILILHRALLL